MKRRTVGWRRLSCLLILLSSWSVVLGAASPPTGVSVAAGSGPARDAQSTSGPTRPSGVESTTAAAPLDATVIANVPAYLWQHGCGPTAAGMIIGYWDAHGFPELIPGLSQTQTAAVNAVIASEGSASHFSEYSQPLDYSSIHPNPLSDRSEPPFGDEHPNNCLADYMRTSQSFYDNYYGWGWFSPVGPAMAAWFGATSYGHDYLAVVSNTYTSNLIWDALRAEIDAGRPVVLLVDTGGDGDTDHFVTGIGYGVDSGVPMYACLDTWNSDAQWHTFHPLAPGNSWGIWGMVSFQIRRQVQVYVPSAHGP
jgi:hypothetical protein